MSVCLCFCLSRASLFAARRLHARRISLRGEGNALYPVLSNFTRNHGLNLDILLELSATRKQEERIRTDRNPLPISKLHSFYCFAPYGINRIQWCVGNAIQNKKKVITYSTTFPPQSIAGLRSVLNYATEKACA